MKIQNEKNETKTRDKESPGRRKFLRNLLGIGFLAGFFRPDRLRTGASPSTLSTPADFWRKGGRFAG